MQRAMPTVVISVPRIFERVHEKILKKLTHTPLIHRLFVVAQRAAVRRQHSSLSFLDSVMYHIGERLIFHKVRHAFGGKLRFAVSGGAALPKHIAEFFESMGVLVLEGYGLTETSPVLTANKIEAHRFGTVGLPLASAELRIATNGEILARGASVMKGYHRAPELTTEVIDEAGWLHTGDIGVFDSDGYLSIVGRIKEMIVLSTGRNIFPVPLEQELEESPLILQAMVYGDNQRAISAFIVPEFKNLQAWCEKEGIEYELPKVLGEIRVIALYDTEIKKMLRHFPHYEQIRNFKLIAEKWTVENDMLTLSQKLKREKVQNKYL
jgi:long-chain acyl-CoA synthetase